MLNVTLCPIQLLLLASLESSSQLGAGFQSERTCCKSSAQIRKIQLISSLYFCSLREGVGGLVGAEFPSILTLLILRSKGAGCSRRTQLWWTRGALEDLEVNLEEVELEELCTYPGVLQFGGSRRGSWTTSSR